MAIYMQVSGIQGSATDQNHQRWIEIDYLEFNSKRHISKRVGVSTSRESGIPHVGEIEIAKTMDKSSPYLLQKMLKGTAIPTVTIDVCQTGNQGAQTVCRYILSDVIISAFDQASIASDHGLGLEALNLNYSKIEKRFIPHDNQGNAGSPITVSYDTATTVTS